MPTWPNASKNALKLDASDVESLMPVFTSLELESTDAHLFSKKL